MPLAFFILIVLMLFLFALWNTTQKFYRPTNFPPGPWQLPFIGNLLTFRISPLKAMSEWHKKYGKIVGLRLGCYRYVMISDYEVLKEAFTEVAFNGRPDFKPTLIFAGGEEHGTVVSSGDSWDTVRCFTIKNLNALGFGKKSSESCIMYDIKNAILSLHAVEAKGKGHPVQLSDNFVIPATSSLWKILVGKYFPVVEQDYVRNCLTAFHKNFWLPIGSVAWQLPWLMSIFPTLTGYNKQKIVAKKLHNLVAGEVERHSNKKDLDPITDSNADNKKDLMSAFLNEVEKSEGINVSQNLGQDEFWHRHMAGMISNLFLTSAEAMTNIMNWAIMYLSMHPEIQTKLWNEIQTVIGEAGEKTPSLDDQNLMPYTQAVMKEVLRISSTSPFSNFHQTTQDVTFRGYFIPKDTIIIGNIFGIHHDEKLYPDPEQFCPERFLEDSDHSNNAPWIPFGVGLRTCLGQAYSKNMFFLMLTTLFQNFEIGLDPDRKKLTKEEIIDNCVVSIFRFCPEFKIVLKKRTI